MTMWCNAVVRRRSFHIVAAVAAAAVVVAAAMLLALHFIRTPKKQASDDYYPDIISIRASTCWEANVFATSKDPFYKWVTGTSIPSLLSKSNQLSMMALYAAAYQKMSVWRVSGKDNENHDVLYTAPDPRLMGGNINDHRNSWIWKMKIHWGIGIRRCINEALNVQINPVEACQLTVPVIPISISGNSTANATRPALASLNVQVPFSGATANSSGHYLSNFASSAKSNVSLGLNRRRGHANESATESSWYYFQDEIKECEGRFPIYYLPDVVSDYAGRQYQCGCISAGRAATCIIGKNLTSIANVVSLGPGCDTALSFWDTELDLGDNTTVLQTYSPRWNTSFAIFLKFTKVNVTYAFSSQAMGGTAPALGRMTECVESWLNSFNSSRAPTDEDLVKFLRPACHDEYISIMPKSSNVKIFGLIRNVDEIIKPMLSETQNETDLGCGLLSKLVTERLCYRMLKSSTKNGIQTLLDDVRKLAQVHHYSDNLWKDDSQKRSQVYLTLLTSVIALFGTMFGMLSRSMTEAENSVLRYAAPRYVPEDSAFHRSLLRTMVRSTILVGSVIAFLVSLFYSIRDINKERQAATSETILHFGGEGAFLVTTTSTVEVEPNWIVYVIFTAFVSLLVVPFSIIIFLKVSRHEDEVKGHDA